MVYVLVWRDNPRALAWGLLTVQAHKPCCTMISSVDIAHGVSHAKYWVYVDCGTNNYYLLWSLELLNEAALLPSQGHFTDAVLMRFQKNHIMLKGRKKKSYL